MIYNNLEDYLCGIVDMYNYSHLYMNGLQLEFNLSNLKNWDEFTNYKLINSNISNLEISLNNWLCENPVPNEFFNYKFPDFNMYLSQYHQENDQIVFKYSYINGDILESLLMYINLNANISEIEIFEFDLEKNDLYIYQKKFIFKYLNIGFTFEMSKYDYNIMEEYWTNSPFWKK